MTLAPQSPFHPVDPARVVLESGVCLAFLDKHPVSQGHTLVVPLRVVASLYQLDESVQSELWDAVRRVRLILNERFHPDGFNVGVNDGVAAGQTVMHAHIHVIPRYRGDAEDPRGGIRWVMPAKAQYWTMDGADPGFAPAPATSAPRACRAAGGQGLVEMPRACLQCSPRVNFTCDLTC